MRHDAKLWNDLLWISGGLLELSKCSYHHIRFDFYTDGNATPSLGPIGPPITIPDNQTNAKIIIPSKSVTNPPKTLGHYKAPAENAATQLSILKTKSNKLGKQVATGPFDSRDACIFYQSIYMKSMGYILPQSFFTKAQLKSIQTAAMSAIIAKCGYTRKTKTEVTYGPTILAGVGFDGLYRVQGIGQIMLFLKFWRTDCQTNRLLRVVMAWAQLSAGTSQPILTNTTAALPHLKVRWLHSLRDFLKEIDAEIEIDHNQVPQIQRQYDMSILWTKY
jgi:hypothetical protein